MQKIVGIAIIFLIVPFFINAQSQTERELNKVAKQLIQKIKNRNDIKTILISDFSDGSIEATELGRFLSEEFSFVLADIPSKFKVIDRSQLKKLLEENQKVGMGLINPLEAAKLGRLRGMDCLLYGTMLESGERYTLYIKVIKIETMEVLVSVRGYITKLPSLPKNTN